MPCVTACDPSTKMHMCQISQLTACGFISVVSIQLYHNCITFVTLIESLEAFNDKTGKLPVRNNLWIIFLDLVFIDV